MKKILMSGQCRIGYTGKETELYDSYGEKLYTGDLVALSVYNEDKPDEYCDYYGIEYVCHNEFEDDGLDKRIYVMGVASEHFMYYDGNPTNNEELADYHETIIVQNHQKWRLRKVKGYEEVVDGEMWGNGKVRTVYEE